MGVQVFVLKPHETRTVFNLGTYAVGTYRFAVSAEATGLLSSIFAKTIPVGATVQLKHFYFVTGHGGAPDDRVERETGAVLTDADAPTTDTVVVTKFHHTVQVEVIVTGSPCEFAVMVTPGAFSATSSGAPASDVNILGQPIGVTVENTLPIAVEFDEPVNVSVVDPVVIDDSTPINVALVSPSPVPVTGTVAIAGSVAIAEPVDVVVTTPVVIDDTTPVQVQVQEPVDVVVTTPVVIDDTTPVQVQVQEPVDVVVTTPVVIDDSTPVNVTIQEPIDVVALENVRQQMLKDPLLERAFTWLDFGTKNQRISTIVYTSTNLPLNTVTRTFSYTLVGTRYRLDTDEWVTT